MNFIGPLIVPNSYRRALIEKLHNIHLQAESEREVQKALATMPVSRLLECARKDSPVGCSVLTHTQNGQTQAAVYAITNPRLRRLVDAVIDAYAANESH